MRKFTFTLNTNAKQRVWNKKVELDFPTLIALFSQFDERDNKDGPCFVPGTFIGEERKSNAVIQIEALVYDVDGKQSYEDLKAKVDALGVVAFIYTTFSHMTTKSTLVVDHYLRWAKKAGRPEREATEEDIVAFLGDNRKDHLKNVKCDMKYRQTAEGQAYTITHDPLEKMRVVFPLDKPIVIADLAMGSKTAINEYKTIYHGVARTIGIDLDTACEDPARLYYFPAKKPNAPSIIWHFNTEAANPQLLNWEAYPRAAVADKSRKTQLDGTTRVVTAGDSTVIDKNGVPINLTAWEHKNYDFDIEALLESVLDDDMIKHARSNGGFHITCPYEAEHSSVGGAGTFCANGDGDHSWTIYCMHDGCTSQNRSKIDHIAELVRQGYVTAQDLGITVAEPTTLPADPVADAARALGIDPTTLGKALDTAVAGEITTYETKPLEGDDLLSVDEVYDQCMRALRVAKSDKEVSSSIGRILAKKCPVDLEEMVEMLADCDLTGWACVKHIRSFLATTDEDVGSHIAQFREFRERKKDFDSWAKDLFDSSRTGQGLQVDLHRMSAYYALPVKEITARYSDYQQNAVMANVADKVAAYYPDLRETYAKVKQGDQIVFLDVPRTIEKRDPELLTRGAISTLLENKNVVTYTPKGKEVRTFVFDRWCIDDKLIKEYKEITFLPRGAPESLPKDSFNMWTEDVNNGFMIPPIEGDCSMITNHIRDVWCNGDKAVYNWVMTWLAYVIQVPGRKPHTSLVLLGPPGTGKSIIFEYGFARILGPMYGASASRDDVAGRWSGHLVGKLMWLSEETLFKGDLKGMQVLKDRISRNTVDVEKKGVDKFPMPSYTRYIFTSNLGHALHIEPDDRRFCVLQTATIHQQDEVYFDAMREYLEGEGANHFLHMLMNWNPEAVGLSWSQLMKPPMTAAKMGQVSQSASHAQQFFIELLTYGKFALTPNDVFKNGGVSWPLNASGEDGIALPIESTRLQACFEDYLRYKSRGGPVYEEKAFRTTFEKFLGREPEQFVKTSRKNPDKKPKRMLLLPGRLEFVQRAFRQNLITKEEYDTAMEDTDSHLSPENEVL